MSETVKRTQDELVRELRARFGDDVMQWAFICPACGDVASTADFRRALDANDRHDDRPSDFVGQMCIGRILGALDGNHSGVGDGRKWTGRGCDWVAFGLFDGPEFVVMPDGREVPCFEIAPAGEAA